MLIYILLFFYFSHALGFLSPFQKNFFLKRMITTMIENKKISYLCMNDLNIMSINLKQIEAVNNFLV